MKVVKLGVLVFILFLSNVNTQATRRQRIEQLFSKVLGEQIVYATSFIPFEQEEKEKGTYPSYIHLNFHGGEAEFIARQYGVNFFDNNNFVTNWVTQVLLDTYALGAIKINETNMWQFENAIDLIATYKDKNFEPGVPIMDFWPATKLSNGQWEQFPPNIGNVIGEGVTVGTYLFFVFEEIGLTELATIVRKIVDEGMMYINVFHIPADFDDTSVNIALGMKLKQLFPSLYKKWTQTNYDWDKLRQYWLKFHYDPFSSSKNLNSIDPRTYFWIRGFLDEEFNTTKSLKLIATWAMDVEEDILNYSEGDKMPLNANNVDASVAANGIYGLTLASLYMNNGTLPSWIDSDIRQMYYDTGRLLEWTLRTDVLSWRPDLALLYYPPIYDFYWFVSRTVFELSSRTTFPFPEMGTVKTLLTKSMQLYGTEQILKRATTDKKRYPWVYWDDFLGDGDTNFFGDPYVRGDDRLFSTSVALNALLDTWNIAANGCARTWRSNTPANVKDHVTNGIAWLMHYILDGQFLPENAFFSGSVKTPADLPWFYPANRIETFNGTAVPPNNLTHITADLIDVMSGYVPKAEYDAMLQQKWFTIPTPLHFHGYNQNGTGSAFPYWSSPSFTYATAMLAIAKYEAVFLCS